MDAYQTTCSEEANIEISKFVYFWGEGERGNIVSWGAGRKWAETKGGARRGRGAEVGNNVGEWIIFR